MSRVLAILGPTAAGKTDLAVEIAIELGAEIISVDSVQVYRGMDIGTAKPTLTERRGVVHHLVDVADPIDEFSVAEFRRLGREVMVSSQVPLIICGGSGLHFRALVDPMTFAPTDDALRVELESAAIEVLVGELLRADPLASDHVDMSNGRRVVRAVEVMRLTGETPSRRAISAEADDLRRYVPEVEFTAIGVDPGSATDVRIDRRLGQMRSAGLYDEVERLRETLGRTARSAVGYREILDHLDGRGSLDEAFDAIGRSTRKLAKKQRTWFQRDPRVQWIPWSDDESERVTRTLEVIG